MFRKFKEAQTARLDEQQRLADQARANQLAVVAKRCHDAWEAAKLDDPDRQVSGVALKKGEVVYLTINGVGLVEPRRAPGQWVGGSHGVSFKIAKGVRYRVGQTRGTYQKGEERPQIIDTGLGVITSQRMLFIGTKRTTEWSLAKLVGFSLEQDGMAIFNVSNRQKASGFAYQPDVDHIIDAVVAAAVARYQSPGSHAAVVAEFLSDYNDAYTAWQAANALLALQSGEKAGA
jgi:hypothetical protein